MYRVSDILQPEFSRSWHEAVAVVQEVASQVVPGSTVPGAEDLLLDQSGALQLGFGPDGPQNPVSALGTLLQSLLEGVEAPGGLRDIANDNAGPSPSLSSVAAFQRALAFYERPARENDLQAIAARLGSPPVAATDPAAEFERLREKVAARAEAAEEKSPTDRDKTARKKMPREMVIGLAVVSLAIVGAIVVYARPHYLATPGALTDSAEQKLADTISTGLNKMGMADGSTTALAKGPAEAPEAVAAATGAAAPSGSRSAPPAVGTSLQRPHIRTPILTPAPTLALKGQLPAALADAGEVPAFGSVEVREVDAVAPMPNAPGGRLEDGLLTYSKADADVEPPRLSRPQLPKQPEPGDDTGYFDVVITESGDVERVQLISPMRRFQERMLMAAAKAWKFRPAMRNGQPVRYRLRIAIILTDKP